MKADILIVDDQEGICMLLNEIFSNAGYHVSTAMTGKEALYKVSKHSYQLIMLDYRLPIIDGAEVLRTLEERGITTPVILMSGLTEHFTKDQINSPIVKHIISKPFDILYMLRIVQAILPD